MPVKSLIPVAIKNQFQRSPRRVPLFRCRSRFFSAYNIYLKIFSRPGKIPLHLPVMLAFDRNMTSICLKTSDRYTRALRFLRSTLKLLFSRMPKRQDFFAKPSNTY